jgi:hypothetical protein
MTIVDRGLVFDAGAAASERRACIFTSVVVQHGRGTHDGRILVAFDAGSVKDAADEGVMISASDDGAQTWGTVAEEVPPPGAGRRWRCINLVEMDDGRHPAHAGHRHGVG